MAAFPDVNDSEFMWLRIDTSGARTHDGLTPAGVSVLTIYHDSNALILNVNR